MTHDKVLTSREQAYSYLKSDDEVHRQAARVWLALRNPGSVHLYEPPQRMAAGTDKRASIRYLVDLPGEIICDRDSQPVKLTDISDGGAKVIVQNMPKLGTTIILHIPLMEAIVAMVVWIGSAAVGLSFITQQSTFVA